MYVALVSGQKKEKTRDGMRTAGYVAFFSGVSLISDLSDVESPSVATARMHLLRRFSRDGLEKLPAHAGGPCVCAETLKKCKVGGLRLKVSRYSSAELAVTAFSQF